LGAAKGCQTTHPHHIATLFGVSSNSLDDINIRFHSYPPTDFAEGGKLLSDLIPFIGKLAKKIFE
jgi:hypothetical protein